MARVGMTWQDYPPGTYAWAGTNCAACGLPLPRDGWENERIYCSRRCSGRAAKARYDQKHKDKALDRWLFEHTIRQLMGPTWFGPVRS
jgi:hypothetical protein